jgi:hypothetical protein
VCVVDPLALSDLPGVRGFGVGPSFGLSWFVLTCLFHVEEIGQSRFKRGRSLSKDAAVVELPFGQGVDLAERGVHMYGGA